MCITTFHVHAQGDTQDSVRVFYGDEISGSIGAFTHGFGIGVRYAKREYALKKTIYEFQVASIHHPKEIKISADKGNRLVYGKSNNVFSFLFSYGKQIEKYSKLDKGSVAVRYIPFGGFALATEKPYYYIVDVENNTYERFDASTTTKFAKAPFHVGLDELKFIPGLFIGASVNFEFSNKNMIIQALEFGGNIQLYARKIEIMYENDNQFIFPTLFIIYRFGKALTYR
ncbi:MAG: hypothetical protein R6U95_00240 [Bacteroidales bacterium]